MTNEEVLIKLQGLDLRTNPYTEAKDLIRLLFNRFAVMSFTLHKGKKVTRARPNEDGERFKKVNELSFKPQKFNTTYQRASTPTTTMFYAGCLPDTNRDNELSTARIIGLAEACPLLREASLDGEKTMTFGLWEVTRDIPLIALCYFEDFIQKSIHTKELNTVYKSNLIQLSEEDQQNSLIITDYFAKEFAKENITDHHDYLLSAVFTEVAMENGFAGVYYPSVRVDGKGFNVAINPKYTHNNLRLIAVMESKLYKLGKNSHLDDEAFTKINPGQKNFTLNQISLKHRLGKEQVYNFLTKE